MALQVANILNFLTPMIVKGEQLLNINTQDEIVAGTLVTRDGAIVNDAMPIKVMSSAPEPTSEEKS